MPSAANKHWLMYSLYVNVSRVTCVQFKDEENKQAIILSQFYQFVFAAEIQMWMLCSLKRGM